MKTVKAVKQMDNRNRQLVALIVKKQSDENREASQTMDQDPWEGYDSGAMVISPPFDPLTMSMLPEQNSEMGPTIDAMEQNIDGFGHRLQSLVNVDAKGATNAIKAEVKAEHVRLMNFFNHANLKDSFTKLRKKMRGDIESTGNGYWEVIRSASYKVQGFEHAPSYQMRLVRQEIDPVLVQVPVTELQIDGSLKIAEISAWMRFRRFIQRKDGITRWFKEFGDPRVYDHETGDLVSDEDQTNWKHTGRPMPDSEKANEIIHWAIYSSRSAYGIPRYIGNLFAIFGDRGADEINFTTFKNNNIPSMIIAISNGQLTQETVERLTQYTESRIQGDNMSKFLVVEAEMSEDGEDAGQMKMEVTPLTGEQHKDALFQEYQKNNRTRIRTSWRISPIFLGQVDDYTRTTAESSRRLTDEQVFQPEREDFDDFMNRRLFPHMGVVYHRYKTNSPNTTDNAELVRLLATAEKTGGMTPAIARGMLEDVFGKDLGPIDDVINPNIPFSLTMAEAVKNLGDPSEPGQSVTALKMLESLTSPGAMAEKLLKVREHIEDSWEDSVFETKHTHEE